NGGRQEVGGAGNDADGHAPLQEVATVHFHPHGCPPKILTGIFVFSFRPTDSLHLTAAERNCQSRSQSWVLPRATERVSLIPPENPKALLRPLPPTLFPPLRAIEWEF